MDEGSGGDYWPRRDNPPAFGRDDPLMYGNFNDEPPRPGEPPRRRRRDLPSWPDRATIERISDAVEADLAAPLQGRRPTRNHRARVLGWWIPTPEWEEDSDGHQQAT